MFKDMPTGMHSPTTTYKQYFPWKREERLQRKMSQNLINPRRRRRLIPVALVGLAAVAFGAFAMSPALSGFTASISNNANSVGSGTLLMTEAQGATTCLSSAAGTVTTANAGTCSTINKLNGSTIITPGNPVTSTVTIKNNGTAAASTFTLTPLGCVTAANGTVNGSDTTGFCGKVDLTISDTTNTTCVYPVAAVACATTPTSAGNLSSLGTTVLTLATPLAAGATRSYTFTVMLDNTATNADQGLLASETLNWAFAS